MFVRLVGVLYSVLGISDTHDIGINSDSTPKTVGSFHLYLPIKIYVKFSVIINL